MGQNCLLFMAMSLCQYHSHSELENQVTEIMLHNIGGSQMAKDPLSLQYYVVWINLFQTISKAHYKKAT